ncbi:Protein of unknown function [Pyronema omphalodes CBS 100304]|uniref:Uncharacterized protein n=1 Tax=Pyronema omphalodes (strain CBS 100304) TaxID=1076935 RepID=U4LJA1_PYROM|nr:Protein of unknown function [Pyronema omphalodes CBS 100304]
MSCANESGMIVEIRQSPSLTMGTEPGSLSISGNRVRLSWVCSKGPMVLKELESMCSEAEEEAVNPEGT